MRLPLGFALSLLAGAAVAADPVGRFVLSDATGARLLTFEPSENAVARSVAVCPGGTIHSIEYVISWW